MPVPENLWSQIEPFLPSEKRRNRWGLIWLTGVGVLAMAALILWISSMENKTEKVTLPESASLSQVNASTTSDQINADNEATITTSRQSGNGNIEKQNLLTSAIERNSSKANNASKSNKASGLNKVIADQFPASTTIDVEGSEVSAIRLDSKSLSEFDNAQDQSIGLNMKEEMLTHRLSLKTPFLALSEKRKLPDPTKDCYSFGRKGSKGGGGVLFAEVYTGPTISTRKLSSRAEDVSTYIAQRDSTESSRLSWHAGLRLGYWHHSGITARIGAHYTQVNERFDYVNGSFVGSVTRIDTFFDSGGNIIDIDTVLVPVSGQRIKTTHNRYHTVDIPLLLGYQVSQNNWTFGIQAGPVFNVAFVKKGDILSPIDGEPVSISDNKPMQYPAYKDKLGMSIYASAHIAHRIGYRTLVYAEPHLHHRLKTLTLDSYPIDQRQTNIGLSIGLRVVLQ